MTKSNLSRFAILSIALLSLGACDLSLTTETPTSPAVSKPIEESAPVEVASPVSEPEAEPTLKGEFEVQLSGMT